MQEMLANVRCGVGTGKVAAEHSQTQRKLRVSRGALWRKPFRGKDLKTGNAWFI